MNEKKMNVNENEEISSYWDLEPVITQNTGVVSKKQLNIKKKLLIILAVIVGICMLCLSMFPIIKLYNKSKYKDEFYVQQEVLKYLEKRYDEEFMVMYNRGMDYAYNYVQLYAYPQGYTDEKHKFEIQGYYNKWGKLDYFDSYVMVKLTDEYEEYIDPIIGEYFDEYKFYVRFNSEWITSNLPPDTKLEDLLRMNCGTNYPVPILSIYLPPDEEVDQLKKFAENLSQKQFRGNIGIKYFKNIDKYQIKERNDWAKEDGKLNVDYVVYSIWVNTDGSIEQTQ